MAFSTLFSLVVQKEALVRLGRFGTILEKEDGSLVLVGLLMTRK